MLFGKTVVVTGVASGIGARTAELAAQAGAEVVGIDVRPPAAPVSSFIAADISSAAAIATLVSQLPARVDALCNVAGVSGTMSAVTTLNINFYGLRALTEAVAPRIREGGSVVNVASIAGYGWLANLARSKALVDALGFPDVAALVAEHNIPETQSYPISKEALRLWTMRAAHQPLFKSRGIRVNAVSPGPVATPILKEFRQVFGDARVDGDIAVAGRAGTAPDIAPVIVFLASDGARWINGANIPVDGGLEAAVNAQVNGF